MSDPVNFTEDEYHRTLQLIEKYFSALPGSDEAIILSCLTRCIDEYEDEHFPIGNEE